ncbi:MAG: hypothetical protein KGQ36_05195 [Rickettsiales bacterium]|nr:hypothetical protein [Rickettsiales bacterium]
MDKISLQNEIVRKALHLLLLLIPITYCGFGKWPSLAIFFAIGATVVTLDYMRHKNPKIKFIFEKIFGSVLRAHELEEGKLCGASYVAIATCVNFLLFKKEIAVIAFTILVISDALAAVIGRSFPSKAFFEKSLIGASAFFVSGLAILIILGINFGVKFGFYPFGLFSLFAVTIIESRPSLLKMDDNLTIPLAFSILMTMFDVMWHIV